MNTEDLFQLGTKVINRLKEETNGYRESVLAGQLNESDYKFNAGFIAGAARAIVIMADTFNAALAETKEATKPVDETPKTTRRKKNG